MIHPKNETEDVLLSTAKNYETLIKQIHTTPEETHEFKKNNTRQTFHFNPPIYINADLMIELTTLEVYNSVFL